MVKNHLKNSSCRIWIRIFTKISSVRPCHTPNLPPKFHSDPSTTFWRYPTHKDRPTDKQRGENITSFTFDGRGNNLMCIHNTSWLFIWDHSNCTGPWTNTQALGLPICAASCNGSAWFYWGGVRPDVQPMGVKQWGWSQGGWILTHV